MSSQNSISEPRLKMRIDIGVLEHLGMKMYTSLPAVVSEYVANAWDAGATEVEIKVPQDQSMGPGYEIKIRDNGRGMTHDDVNDKFLRVARKRRHEEDESFEVNGQTRKVMGRKGIGKLAGFGVSDHIEILTARDGEYVRFELDYDKIQDEDETADSEKKPLHEPKVLEYGPAPEEKHGTLVVLTDLNRSQRPREEYIRRRIARRFDVIGENFEVQVNGEPISPDERDLREDCQFIWKIGGDDADIDGQLSEKHDLDVTGWIGTRKKPVPDEIGTGVAVMARGKMAQKPNTFGVEGSGTEGQHALSYILGEVRADFLDEGEDLIATDRNSVYWEKPPADELHDWLNVTIKEVCKEWAEKRSEERMKGVKELSVYEDRIKDLSTRERNLADKFLKQISKIEGYDEETLEETADYVATAVEKKAFADLLEEISSGRHEDPQKVIELFQEWEILDAAETFRRAENRLQLLKEFDSLIASAEVEEDLHDFLARNPSLLDPRWNSYDKETTFQQKLRDRFGDDAEVEGSNRRMDFFCLKDANSIQIIELKKADETVKYSDLQQIQHYVNYISNLEGSEFEGKKTVGGLIIGGELTEQGDARELMRTLEVSGINHKTYEQLYDEAWDTYEEFVEVIEEKAEVTGDARLEKRAESMRKKAEAASD